MDGNYTKINIRKITPSGAVVTIISDPTLSDYNFRTSPSGDNYLYTNSGRVFKIDGSGNKTEIIYDRFLTPGIEAFDQLNSIEVDASGTIFFIAKGSIYKLEKSGKLSLFYQADKNPFYPGYIQSTIDFHGNIYIVESFNMGCKIKKVNNAGLHTFIDVKPPSGMEDLFVINNVTVDSQGNFYFIVYGLTILSGSEELPRAHHIYKMDKNGIITRIAGNDAKTPLINGSGLSATFNFPLGIVIDNFNNLYIADSRNNLIRKIEIRK
ncbi:hypothetical protein [Mucilaginibacter sp. HD30]